ncbi:hypothetical protein A2U01_0106960, partial [Trifolium medium]|nr:hypothetical protein [Trifolium medium]
MILGSTLFSLLVLLFSMACPSSPCFYGYVLLTCGKGHGMNVMFAL